jgi:hypothetical protein
MERYTDTISGEELYTHTLYGSKYYFKDQAMTIIHRLDGPAVERSDGTKEWWYNNKLHRLDGPAIEWAQGNKSWYVNDIFIMQIDKRGDIVGRME